MKNCSRASANPSTWRLKGFRYLFRFEKYTGYENRRIRSGVNLATLPQYPDGEGEDQYKPHFDLPPRAQTASLRRPQGTARCEKVRGIFLRP